MREKERWNLSHKSRQKYLEAAKLLYGRHDNGSEPIALPAASQTVLRLSVVEEPAEKPPAVTAQGRVPRGTCRLKAPRRKEWREQADIYQWTQTQEVLRGFVMKFDNEGRRSVAQAAVAKRMGLLAGVSDLFVARPSGRFCGLWLEVKQAREYTPSERRSETWKRQEAFQERMRSAGFAARFAFGAEDGIKIIRSYVNLGIREVTLPSAASIPPDRDDR